MQLSIKVSSDTNMTIEVFKGDSAADIAKIVLS
jgi:hypothetical protein